MFYQIYPLSFKDSNNDGVGDIRGIIEKLDYLQDGTDNSLGIGAVWLSPIYKSPMRDCGYDVSDYYSIDSIFGTMEDFDRLITEAHKRNIKVIMDFVPNHTSSEHPWFVESRSSRDNPKRGWYKWRDPTPDGKTPNDWGSIFGGSAWTYDALSGQYYFHQFLDSQPDLNWQSPGLKKEMEKVLKFWLDRGVDGFRVDALYSIVDDGYLKNNSGHSEYNSSTYKNTPPVAVNGNDYKKSELKEFILWLCSVVSKYKEKIIINEVYLNQPELLQLYKLSDSYDFCMPFNFGLFNRPWSAASYKEFVDKNESLIGKKYTTNYVLGNHDVSRLATRVGSERARLLAMLLLALPGMPFIYYGEELGMKDGVMPVNKRDSFGRFDYSFNLGRDPERTPMQWGEEHDHFTPVNVKPWLPIAENYAERNVDAESKDPLSFFNLYKLLIHLRNKTEVIKSGKYESVSSKDENLFIFARTDNKQKVYVVLNFAEKEIDIPDNLKTLAIHASTHMNTAIGTVAGEKKKLRPHEGLIFW